MKFQWATRNSSHLVLAGTLALAGAGAHAALNAYMVLDAAGHQFSGEVQDNHLYLLDKGKKSLAPDGTYKMDGSVRQVRNGMLLPAVQGQATTGYSLGDSSAHSNRPVQSSGKPGNAGETHGFNPQPDPPGFGANSPGGLSAPAAQGAAGK
ncbi:MAG: hypothetical protein JWN73_5182 [Betaproteobacteria bacterium]|nr:hypothetical protein [Betaproteobacteria bacterium]